MHEGLKLQYLPFENERLKEIIEDLLNHVRNAPCLVSHPGELTYECRHDNPCRVCEWRVSVLKDLQREWDIQLP